MNRATLIALLIVAVIAMVYADVYVHSPRGFNNRLNERSATRNNNNRIFNSQNNNRGGYNVSELTASETQDAGDLADKSPNIQYNIKSEDAHQYAETYYEGSELIVAWTNQHGCGGNPTNDPHNTHCNIIIQYTCEATHEDPALNMRLYNGLNTGTPGSSNIAGVAAQQADNDANRRGRHENEQYYAECNTRKRNQGLFLADQKLNGDTAIYTRQNAGGNRSGLECEEEREYYPYWSPSPWRDVAYLSSELGNINIDPCAMVTAGSQNNNEVFKCVPPTGTAAANAAPFYEPITAEACAAANGVWKGFTWGLPAPDCAAAQYTRDNHLGSNRDGHYQNYTWSIPPIEDVFKGTTTTASTVDAAKCVVRIRYNITTADYDPWNTFSESNGANSPVTNNPTVPVGGSIPLRLALNTAQTGRTFQDRSHVFTIRRRPAELADKRIVNMNMIGKRCNIVECYPAVEYLWMPSHPVLSSNDALHIQWVGVSNTHNNGANGGDGQTGDSGQGQTGTDRHNMVLTLKEDTNFPIPLDKFDNTLWDKSTCHRVTSKTGFQALNRNDCAVTLATSGHFTSTALDDTHAGTWQNQMNNSPPSLIGGVVLTNIQSGQYPFICSRDNNFTNRDQKGVITVP